MIAKEVVSVVGIVSPSVHWLGDVVVSIAHVVVEVVVPMQKKVVMKIATRIVLKVVAPRCAGGTRRMGSPSRGQGQNRSEEFSFA